MNKQEMIQRLNEINFKKDAYWLITGGAMVLYGLREHTNDIDLGCHPCLADQLEKAGYPVTKLDDGTRKIVYDKDIEIFEDWLCGEVEMLEGIPVISLEGLREMKKQLGRAKDWRDIQLIDQFLKWAE